MSEQGLGATMEGCQGYWSESLSSLTWTSTVASSLVSPVQL